MPWLPVAIIVSICTAAAVARIFLGPTRADRLVGLDTVNTYVVVAMVVLGIGFNEVIYIDVAIVYALLSFVTTLFIAKYIEKGSF